MKLIQREPYLRRLVGLLGTPDIKVITGMRRTGKSVLLGELADFVRQTEPDANIIMINLQELENEPLLEYHQLHTYVMSRYQEGRHNLLLIDEVQLCQKFELAVNSLHAKQLFDIFVTGSNAFLLSSDLATLFTGRTVAVEVYPFSFKEFLQYFPEKTDLDAAFEEYARMGGMPGSYPYADETQRYAYLHDVYRTVLVRDLVEKYRIRNKTEFENIAAFMMDNIGGLLSPNAITKTFHRQNDAITQKTVAKYISYLERAFLFYGAKRYDLKGKKYLASSVKYYLSDPVFRYAVNGTRNLDRGRVYENLVYLELLRRGYEVYVGKLYRKEIDFVAKKQKELFLIQVSDQISEKTTFNREVTPLLSIRDAYPKLVIARTREEEYQYRGVRILDIASFLAGKG